MKKVLALVTALVLTLAMAVGASASVPDKPSEFACAYDFDGSVLSSSTKTTIEQYGAALEEATGIQTIAVVVDFLDGEDPADYATDIINSWGVGQSGENNGVVVLLARGDRKIQIGTGTGVDRVMSGAKCGDLIDDNIDYFADNKFDKGLLNLYEDVCTYLARAKGKTLSLSSSQSASSSVYSGGYDNSYGSYDEEGFDLFEFILGVLFVYIIICVLFNALMPSRGGCLSYFFMGWLFGRGSRRPPRGPRPPMVSAAALARVRPVLRWAAAVPRVLPVRAVLPADSAAAVLAAAALAAVSAAEAASAAVLPAAAAADGASERAEPAPVPEKL